MLPSTSPLAAAQVPKSPVPSPRLLLRDELQTTFASTHTIERELAGGGMSSVFVATETALGRKVVIKVLPYELAATVSVDRFRREIMLAAALQHPHIVPVLSAGQIHPADGPESGLPYFIMPYVEGESLRARLARGPLSVRETLSILKDVARALAYAHGRGIIHRDIKPDNVLLSGGSATVTDFGVAKAITAARERLVAAGVGTTTPTDHSITLVGTSIGTPAYMAPEQAAGDPAVDHRADIYALGIVGYEMLVGTPPFHGRTPQALLAAQLTESPAPIASRRYDVPVGLVELIDRCLEKEPDKRPAMANDIVRTLDDPDVASGAFASVARPKQRGGGRPGSTSRDAIKRWGLAIATVVMVGAAVASATWMLRRGAASRPVTLAAAPVQPSRSVAVLPLVNIGSDTSDAYFAEGMTTELTTALSRIPGVRVASRTAANAARTQYASLADIGTALKVSMVLEGTVQRDRDRMRVTARLVSVGDGFTVWSDMYQRQVTDVFAVQDDISQAIVEALSPELSGVAPEEVASAKARGTSDVQAYDLYLRGRFFFQKRGEASLRRALDYFRQAIDRDSMFARAYTGVADVYSVLPLYAAVVPDSVFPDAMRAVNRAVAIDSTLPEAFASRAALLQAQWRWADAERDYRRALAIDPASATAHQWYGELLLLNGRVDEARAQLARATELDPLSPVMFGSYALALAAARQYEQAISAGRRAVEIDSSLIVSRFMLGSAYLQARRLPDAIRELERAAEIDPANVQTLGLLGYAYAQLGNVSSARELAARLAGRPETANGAQVAAARIAIALGDRPKALDLLEQAAGRHDASFSSESLVGSYFDPLRGEPRFQALVRRLGLDERILRR
jgi:serine/threonine protein kinase/TolB-like protein/Tfp pilus assembly protein PilF